MADNDALAHEMEAIKALFKKERAFYLTNDYLGSALQDSKNANEHWREIMCEWAYNGKLLSCSVDATSFWAYS